LKIIIIQKIELKIKMGNLVDSECCSKRAKLLPTTNGTIARYENNRQNNDSLHSI